MYATHAIYATYAIYALYIYIIIYIYMFNQQYVGATGIWYHTIHQCVQLGAAEERDATPKPFTRMITSGM